MLHAAGPSDHLGESILKGHRWSTQVPAPQAHRSVAEIRVEGSDVSKHAGQYRSLAEGDHSHLHSQAQSSTARIGTNLHRRSIAES